MYNLLYNCYFDGFLSPQWKRQFWQLDHLTILMPEFLSMITREYESTLEVQELSEQCESWADGKMGEADFSSKFQGWRKQKPP